jgi:hypothetical protein
MGTRTSRNAAAFAITHIYTEDWGVSPSVVVGGTEYKQKSEDVGFQLTASIGMTEEKGKFEYDRGVLVGASVGGSDYVIYKEDVGVGVQVSVWEADMGEREEGHVSVSVSIMSTEILVPLRNVVGTVVMG